MDINLEEHSAGPWLTFDDPEADAAYLVDINNHPVLDAIEPATRNANRRLAEAAPLLLKGCHEGYEALMKCVRYLLGSGPQPQPKDVSGAQSAMYKALKTFAQESNEDAV